MEENPKTTLGDGISDSIPLFTLSRSVWEDVPASSSGDQYPSSRDIESPFPSASGRDFSLRTFQTITLFGILSINATIMSLIQEQGWMNSLFEDPPLIHDGPDSPARQAGGNLLPKPGSPARVKFDKTHEVKINVEFKIAFEDEPDEPQVRIGGSTKSKPKKTFTVINSNNLPTGKGKFVRACLIGKSLNEFKVLCGNVIGEMREGMNEVILTGEMAKELIWKVKVGKTPFTLSSYTEWQEFVDTIDRSKTKIGDLTISTPSDAQKKRELAAVSATDRLLNKKTLTPLEIKINGTATLDMPPNSQAYREIMKKSKCRGDKSTSKDAHTSNLKHRISGPSLANKKLKAIHSGRPSLPDKPGVAQSTSTSTSNQAGAGQDAHIDPSLQDPKVIDMTGSGSEGDFKEDFGEEFEEGLEDDFVDRTLTSDDIEIMS
ncbi:uncharacterized protein MELLADRAFT_111573 [Melampsora larici-populina 98AG31]|uniref:Uncharacterized protein n=1 Tax=Melampsora larici-populina (strain 98AG31 / pathotype 3-4-7) TaxID=747676 RepID=F4S3M6_MELLP|nr:uncharacterized protein MELLADRAFT_111573 [Melampsora larici-populina 98AG31]EGG00771.1 hypothetical protein MELLADRAFT_111573 [Melampsora larici-populina 98AG31]